MALSDKALVTLVQAKNYLRVDAAASLKVDAEYVGIGDAIETKIFTLDHTPVEGSLKLYLENVPQVDPTHFSIAVATITFVTAPPDGDIITASYDRVWEAGDDPFESYDDELLERLIEAATKKAEDYTGRAFVQRQIIEMHIGDNKQMLRLYKQPIISIDGVVVDGDAFTDYISRLSIGRIYHFVVWPEGDEIMVTYTAGYTSTRATTQVLIPDAVSAVLLIIANLFENRTDQLKSESIAGLGSVTYDIPSQAKELLNPLRVDIL